MDWQLTCRVCLGTGDMVSLFDWDENNEQLSDKFTFCCGIEVRKNYKQDGCDGHPATILLNNVAIVRLFVVIWWFLADIPEFVFRKWYFVVKCCQFDIVILGVEKRFVTDANMSELCGSAGVRVSVQAAMPDVQRNPERVSRRIREKLSSYSYGQHFQRYM